jgi:hypothetical protein
MTFVSLHAKKATCREKYKWRRENVREGKEGGDAGDAGEGTEERVRKMRYTGGGWTKKWRIVWKEKWRRFWTEGDEREMKGKRGKERGI